MSSQSSFEFMPEERTWEERDYHGFRQTRTHYDDGWSNWIFYASTFGGPVVGGRDTIANVLRTGGGTEPCPIDARGRILIAGTWWGHRHWDH